MADLTLHPDARKRFDERARALVQRLAPIVEESRHPYLTPDLHVAATISSYEIEEVINGSLDHTGAEISRSFPAPDGKEMGLWGHDYAEFANLVEAFQGCGPLRKHISRRFAARLIFAWIRDAYLGSVSGSMSDRVLEECAGFVKHYEVWVPLSDLFVETEWDFGRVQIRPFGRHVFDHAASTAEGGDLPPGVKAALLRRVERNRKRFQGHATVVASIEAEPGHATDRALAIAEVTADMLRLFHPSQFTPRSACHLDVDGQAPDRMTTCFLFSDEVLAHENQSATNPTMVSLALSSESLERLEGFLTPLSNLLRSEDRTPFQILGLAALRRYSRGVLAASEEDRLLYVLVAAESVLLKNESEPIQQAISDRMAFFLESDATARLKLVGLVKSAYAARSGYVHHGRTIAEEEDLAAFFLIAWRFFMGLIDAMQRFHTRDAFIKSIEDVKYS